MVGDAPSDITIDGVRKAATDAGASPAECPIPIEVVAGVSMGSAYVMAPTIEMTDAQLENFVTYPPKPGEVTLPAGDDVALGGVRVKGDGEAALLVKPDGIVTGDKLTDTAKTFLGQIRF
jgi:predicted acylesterase/phospholipase RssA